ncbi:MAG: hypothetical protein HY764_02685 [Candidatus Portnoybacteria bacterium]|nr:hypothetical protein [Candidatus Portnoybacteria bacterium]
MKKIKNFLGIISPTLPIIGFATLLLILPLAIHWARQLETYGDFKEILTVLIWPLTILFLLLTFRKVFNYTFLSLRKFNLFGFAGILRNPEEVIKEEAEKMMQEQKREEEARKLQELSLEDIRSYAETLYGENLRLKSRSKNLEARASALQAVLRYTKKLGVINFMEAEVIFATTTYPTSNSVVFPQNNFEAWRNSVTINNRKVNLEKIVFRQIGNINPGDLYNFRLFVDGVQVGSSVNKMELDAIEFDLTDTPKQFDTGTRTIKLLVDINEAALNKDFAFSLESKDVEFFDPIMYTRVEPTTTDSSTPLIRATASTLTIRSRESQ